MKAFAGSLLVILLSVGFPICVKAQTYTPASSGNWTSITWNCVAGTNPCATYPGQTYSGDIVNITSSVTLTSALAQSVGAVTLSNADLTINGSFTFTCASIDINASGSGNANLNINNAGTGSPNVNVTGNVTITRNTSATSGTKLKIGGGASVTTSTVTIGGNLTYTDSGSGKESEDDISLGATTNDQCTLSVTGDINLTFSYANAAANDSGLKLAINQISTVTTNNLTLTLTEGGLGAVNQIFINSTGAASLTVNGNATLSYQDTSTPSSSSYNTLNQNQICEFCNPSIVIKGDLYMTSPANTTNGSPTSNPNNRIYAIGSSTFTLYGNVKFLGPTLSTYTMNRIYLSDHTVFNLFGQILDFVSGTTYSIITTGKNQGEFDFQYVSPYSNTNTIKFLGSIPQNFPARFGNSLPAASYKNVVINNTSGTAFTIPTNNSNSTLNIQSTLTLTNGIITSTSTNYVVLDASASCPNGGSATSFVDGKIQKNGSNTASLNVDLIFPTGKVVGSTKYWAPIQVSSISGPTSATTFTAEYFHNINSNTTTDLTFDHISQVEYWNLNVVGTPTATVTLYWKDARTSYIGDVTTGTSQDLFISRFNTSTSQWNLLSPSTINSPSYDYNHSDYTGSITATGLTTFGNLTFAALGKTSNPLPITLSDFSFEFVDQDFVNVKWMTNSEVNNDYFILYRSFDGLTFYKIDSVTGAGTTNQIMKYNFVDKYAQAGKNYYRLYSRDFDGTLHQYDRIIYVLLDHVEDEHLINVFPNPSRNSKVVISFRSGVNIEPGSSPFRIFSTQGIDVTNQFSINQIDANNYGVATNSFSSGLYIIVSSLGSAKIILE